MQMMQMHISAKSVQAQSISYAFKKRPTVTRILIMSSSSPVNQA